MGKPRPYNRTTAALYPGAGRHQPCLAAPSGAIVRGNL